MRHHCKLTPPHKGFTLIELLVVVLIVGILTAIGIPMYMKTIQRSRVAEAITLLKYLKDEQKQNSLLSNTFYQDFDELEDYVKSVSGTLDSGNNKKITVKDLYAITLNPQAGCASVEYPAAADKTPLFTVAVSYTSQLMGCDGEPCQVLPDITRPVSEICSCPTPCGPGFERENGSCACACNKECNQNGSCFDKYPQAYTLSGQCLLANPFFNPVFGTETIECTPTCDGESCTTSECRCTWSGTRTEILSCTLAYKGKASCQYTCNNGSFSYSCGPCLSGDLW